MKEIKSFITNLRKGKAQNALSELKKVIGKKQQLRKDKIKNMNHED